MIQERLNRLRIILAEKKIDGYIVPTVDEYFSEYVPDCAKRLEFITGFTGSNGIAIILKDTILFFTDGRYITQAFTELDDHLFEIFDQKLLADFPWDSYITDEDIIAFDPKLFSVRSISYYSSMNTKAIEQNLIDSIWDNKPHEPNSKVYAYLEEFAGQDYAKKIAQCREVLSKEQAESMIIINPDSVCWLLNIRAHDVEFSPLLLANVIVTQSRVYLFVDKTRLDSDTLKAREDIVILPKGNFQEVVFGLEGRIIYDKNYSSLYLLDLIKDKENKHLNNPCILWKACKNKVEIEYAIQGHIQDAVAVCESLSFIANSEVSKYNEYDIGQILTDYRKKRPGYVMDSFPAICGYQENGAVIHYRAKQNSKKLEGEGLLLIDSGGQYLGATTDITRTISIGKATKEHREFYTRVLKGHIALATVVFPANSVTGANLDVLARQYLWKQGADYAHGTGHGVGSFLSVHEEPCSISLSGYGAVLKLGMVLSNEPGYYVPGEYGIRIENLMYVSNADADNFLQFNMLTMVPYAKDLIVKEMLNTQEMKYIKSYYEDILSKVEPLLSDGAKTWLENEMIF